MTNVAQFPVARNSINIHSLSQGMGMPLFSKPQQNMLSFGIFASQTGDKFYLSVVLIYISLAMKETEYVLMRLRKNPSVLTFPDLTWLSF